MTTWRVLVGDVRDRLAELPDGSVQTCITSPPYWGLRDYGTAAWAGGDVGCEHAVVNATRTAWANGVAGPNGRNKNLAETHWKPKEVGGECGRCGAVRIDAQIGLEASPDAFVAALVDVFRAVRRVLADDGTLWMNLGDSYLAQQGAGFNGQKRLDHANRNVKVQRPDGMKPKDLAGIPWMVAFALRADGWYLRSDIIWHKPNPMPESITDRPTKSHEYLFLLAKSARYYYDADAIREAVTGQAHSRGNGVNPKAAIPGSGIKQNTSFSAAVSGLVDERNKRTVWTIATQPYAEAHFATYPEALVEPCVLAGSRVGDLVLDPFTGSGTTGVVALRHGRSFVGCELNPTYAELARTRIGSATPLFSVEVGATVDAVDPDGGASTDGPRADDLLSPLSESR